ncbi:unnamed protein product [Ectocarpus sp. 12 AP-2014]
MDPGDRLVVVVVVAGRDDYRWLLPLPPSQPLSATLGTRPTAPAAERLRRRCRSREGTQEAAAAAACRGAGDNESSLSCLRPHRNRRRLRMTPVSAECRAYAKPARGSPLACYRTRALSRPDLPLRRRPG